MPLVDVVGDPRLEARIEAAVAEAKAKRLSGDRRGAREVVLSILAIDDEHAEARRLLTELELAPKPPAPKPSGLEAREPTPQASRLSPASPEGPPAGSAWPAAVVAPAEPPTPFLGPPRPAAVRPAPLKTAVRAPSRGLSGIQLGAIALAAAVLVAGAVLLMRPTVSPTGPVAPPAASPSPQSTAREQVTAVVEAPPSPAPPPTATPVDREIGRKVEALLARGDYAEAQRAADDGLRSHPSEPGLRALQQRVQTEVRRADAARAAAAKAGAAEARAEATSQRRDLAAAAAESDRAATTMEQARRAAREAPASSPPVTPPAAASGSEADREAVVAVINRYAAAMEARDLAALKAVWPGLSGVQESKIRSAFQFARSLRVRLHVTGVQLDNGTAVVSCLRKVTIVTTEGQTAQNDQTAVIRLAKTDGWSIEAIQ